jgi:hypothetical protein
MHIGGAAPGSVALGADYVRLCDIFGFGGGDPFRVPAVQLTGAYFALG